MCAIPTLRDRFERPPRQFSPTPLWWWSGDRVEAPRLRWQLERLAAGGVFNVVLMNLAPTSPLYGSDRDDPEFLSERWWELFHGVCRDAQELGVSVWFYDQIGFSGANFQGQIVRAHPEHAGRWLERTAIDADGEAALECSAGGTPVGAAAIPLGADGEPAGPAVPVALEGRSARWRGTGPHRLSLFHTVERGFDYFSPLACERLFSTVHGQFEARAAEWLGSVVVGSFQDELPSLPTWSPTFVQEFERRRGYDPVPHLAYLWEDGGEAGERLRGDVHAVRGALAEEAFFAPLHAWHERHGLLCGVDQQYGGREGFPVRSAQLYADYPRTHRWFSAPGSDHHGDAKIHSSLAHHYGRDRVWIEAFHSSGWGGTLEETFDWLLPWLVAGATLYDPHATYYSTRQGWWEWAPPATDWRQPYWRHYEHFSRAVTRLCALLSWGEHACDVGVLFPNATAQAGLRLDGATPAALRADALYREIVGRMTWFSTRPGALDRLARDYDVLDDDTIARATAGPDGLATDHERYRAIVLPGCEVLEARTAERLAQFVDGGGTLVAVGALPARAAGGDGGGMEAVSRLRERFEAGAARLVASLEGLGDALAAVPARVRAPVPTLVRTDGERTLVLVPAAHPRATEMHTGVVSEEDHMAWADGVAYRFDPGRYAEEMEVLVAGVQGAPELWEPFSGRRVALEADAVDGGMRVRVPFSDGPCAVLVWGEDGDVLPPRPALPGARRVLEGPWDVEVEATLEDDWGDLAASPRGEGTVVQAWALEHHRAGEEDWSTVHATFGPRALACGPAPPEELPAPGEELPAPSTEGEARAWRAVEWSDSRGIHKDPIHVFTLGPSGRVPEEFLDFGPVPAGEAVHLRTVVTAEAALRTHLFVGAGAAKRAWLGGEPVALEGDGYLASGELALPAGETTLDLRLTTEADVERLRGHFAFVADAAGYARPEWLRAGGHRERSSVVAFATTVSLPARATAGEVLVGANGPCRVLVDGAEVGRQGGFDPYDELDRDRLQPYDLTAALTAGEHELRLELLDLGRSHPSALVDSLLETSAGTVAVASGAGWTATRDGLEVPVLLRLEQRFDPAYANAWRRPHPLPGGAWLEPGRAAADPGGPVSVKLGGAPELQELRLLAPPGALRIEVPLVPGSSATVVLQDTALPTTPRPAGGVVAELPGPGTGPRECVLAVVPPPGLARGALLTGPVSFLVGPGRMPLVDWASAGLASHSGGVRYSRRLEPPEDPGASLVLDLGEVRGTAEVLVDGRCAGVRVASPYAFDLSGLVGPEGARLEVLVLNTLAPHLDAVSPTTYVMPGQKRSGLFGPIALTSESAQQTDHKRTKTIDSPGAL